MTSKMKDLTTIFVYGTLKRNEPNHHLMIERNAQFISEGSTVKIWPLIVTTERNVPYLLDTNKVGKVNTSFLSFENLNHLIQRMNYPKMSFLI